MASRIVGSFAELATALDDNVGAVLMTEEALLQADWSALTAAVASQPSWSSYPFVLLVSQRRNAVGAHAIYERLPREISNVMVLERPMGSAVLLSAVRWALGGRRRQFITRDHLAELERHSQQQRLMTRELAHRVKNTIAILQSIVTQTIRPHPEMQEVAGTILERFSALSRAHDLLLGNGFTSADFRDLVDRALVVHQG
ncbi:MAG: sensor histidine kinase, partial [Alphaproteobacteria bacterium]